MQHDDVICILHREIITIVKPINISMSSYTYFLCVCVVRALKIYSLSKFPVFNTVLLTIVIMCTLDH